MSQFETPRRYQRKEEFKTKFSDSEMVTEVARFEVQEMKRILRHASNVTIPDVDTMERYLKTILWMRIEMSNDVKIGPYHEVSRRVRIPARWYVLMVNVGQAHDAERNFKFTPVYDMTPKPHTFKQSTKADDMLTDGDKLLTPNELKDWSEIFESYLQDGYSTVAGIPRDFEGSIHLMAKTTIQEIVRGTDITNPVYAFLASILGAEVVSDTYQDLALMFRIQYSSTDVYETQFSEYFRSVSQDIGTSDSGNYSSATRDGKGPAQPRPGSPAPNLGHNGNGAVNDNGNLKG